MANSFHQSQPATMYYMQTNQFPGRIQGGNFPPQYQGGTHGNFVPTQSYQQQLQGQTGKSKIQTLSPHQVNFAPSDLQQPRMQQQFHHTQSPVQMPYQNEGFQHHNFRARFEPTDNQNTAAAVVGGPFVGQDNSYQARSSIGIMGSPGKHSGSQKVSVQGSSYGAWTSASRGLTRSKQLNSSTTGDSNGNGWASQNNERSSSLMGVTSPGTQAAGWMDMNNQTDQDFQKVKKIWDPITPTRTKQSLSPSTLAHAERNMTSPIMANNLAFQYQQHMSLVTTEQKPFRRKRVNTRTPSRKSTAVVLNTAKMNWEIAREIVDSVMQIVSSDQIKNCNMELEKQQIKVELASVESACKIVEAMNNKDIREQKVKAFYDQALAVASPKPGVMATSSSPAQQANQTIFNANTQQVKQQHLMQMQNMAQTQQLAEFEDNPGASQFHTLHHPEVVGAQHSGHDSGKISPRQHLDGILGNFAPNEQQTQPNFCPCCRNGHANLVMQHSHSTASVSSHVENFHPSGGTSSYERLNRSPGMVRTLDNPIKAGDLGLNVGHDGKHYSSQNAFPHQFHQYPHTPNSNAKSSSKTNKSANGSQNASSTSKSNRTKDSEPVIIEMIRQAKDLRTYLCVKNIPCKYQKKELRYEIDRTHKNRYSTLDIIAEKKEPKKLTNMGYFFIDFKHPLFVLDFYEEYQGKTWELHNSDKKVGIYYGHNQKKECHNYHKLDTYLMGELMRISQKYDIQVPLDSFQRQVPVAPQSQVSSFGPSHFQVQQSVSKSLSQLNLSTNSKKSSLGNFAIAECEKENEANEMSDEKKTT